VGMKVTTEQLETIYFGLGIAQAWQDQKIENGDGSCIPKSYLCEVQVIILDEINRRKNKSDIFRIRRIMNLLNFFR
jgi:hypothetical protein